MLLPMVQSKTPCPFFFFPPTERKVLETCVGNWEPFLMKLFQNWPNPAIDDVAG